MKKTYLLFPFLLFLLSSCVLAQPAQRIKLTQLEQAPSTSGSRQGQIGMSDVAGNQRYTAYVIIADTCTNVPPTPSGNTNISQFVYNCAGDSIWYIDWKGDAILLQGGAGAGCDSDWLDIVTNNCPDNINDSIYTYLYAAVGARYAWPLAEFLVNDSTGTAISVIQGSRNARLGFHDSQNDTWSAINFGGSTATWYLEQGDELIVTASSGSISIPTIPFTNHFAIRTNDSTLVFYRYPSSRVDTNTVTNILHTDANGVLKSANFANSIPTGIGFGNVIYHDDTYSGAERVGSWYRRFGGTFISALDSLLAYPSSEGAAVEISPGRTTLSAYPSANKNNKSINIIGGTGSYLDITALYNYVSPDTITEGQLNVIADTIRFGGLLTSANTTRYQPTGGALRFECNTILNSSASVAKSPFFHLKAKNWVSNTGTYLINPVFTQQKLGDTVTNVSAYIDIDQITLTGTGTAPRALSYLNSTFDSCALEFRIGSIKKAGTIPAGTGRGFSVHVYSYGSTDTTVVNNSKINTYVGSASIEGPGASDNPFICFRPGNPGGTGYPVYVKNSQINYTLGAVGLSEKLIEFTSLTEMTNSQITVQSGSARVTNDNMIYFQRVTLDSTTIVFDGDYTSTSSGNPLIYLDSVTFTNGARIIFRGRYEHQSDGTPVVQLLNMSSIPAGSIVFDNCTLISYDTATIIGTASVSARGLKTSRNPQSTITVVGNYVNTSTTDYRTNYSNGAFATYINSSGGYSGMRSQNQDYDVSTYNNGTFLSADNNYINMFSTAIESYAPFFLLADSTNLRFQEAGGANYTEIAAGQQTANIYYRLPVVDGQDSEVLTWRPGGLLEWDSINTIDNLSVNHLSGSANTLTADIEAAAGTGASVALVGAQSSDLAGRFTVTSGTGATTGLWVTINFDSPFTQPPVVQFDCEDANCAGLRWYSNASTTNVELFIASGQSDGTSYSFNYHIIQAE